ncbi:hypothetical protein, partial [Caulobacter sp. BE254]|uniref:hypothetical protein n=1 Tax=Caulobacter sp. BE254 TaxID=2817720 RepID=UPI00286A8E0C
SINSPSASSITGAKNCYPSNRAKLLPIYPLDNYGSLAFTGGLSAGTDAAISASTRTGSSGRSVWVQTATGLWRTRFSPPANVKTSPSGVEGAIAKGVSPAGHSMAAGAAANGTTAGPPEAEAEAPMASAAPSQKANI